MYLSGMKEIKGVNIFPVKAARTISHRVHRGRREEKQILFIMGYSVIFLALTWPSPSWKGISPKSAVEDPSNPDENRFSPGFEGSQLIR